jgi:Ni,Fe-hydrogenase I large subunit
VTARGLLMHEARLAPDASAGHVVSRYALCAPTEWNFHPLGPLPRWLEGAAAGSAAEARSLLLRAAGALDPCVECRVVIVDGQSAPAC